jgi:acetyl-CoA carboxylase biotin carboxylase subunit
VPPPGLTFVGPSGDAIRLMGDKVSARVAAAAGVPVVPGSDGPRRRPRRRGIAAETGFPVMIKAAAGGGGRGIRIAHDMDEFEPLMPQASAEAKAAFGDGGLYMEKVVERARHIEVQVLGDGKRAMHCFERECSLQRRRQKVWEEAPSPCRRGRAGWLCASAVALAEAVGYSRRRHGRISLRRRQPTLLLHRDEHPHPGRASGDRDDHRHRPRRRDAAHRRRRAAALQPGDITPPRPRHRGPLNAEDPAKNFLPFPGTVDALRVPGGPGVRFDTMLYAGYTVPPFYDSLLGKLIVWDETARGAITRLRPWRWTSSRSAACSGLKTTKPPVPEARQGRRRAGRPFTRAGWKAGLTANAGRQAVRRSREVGDMKTRYSFGGDEHIFVESTRRCRWRPSSSRCP